jgi:aspartate racemase
MFERIPDAVKGPEHQGAEEAVKTIGLIGGMSWESSIEYYRAINETVRTECGGLHSAKCLMYSVDFAEIEPLQERGEWGEAGRRLAEVGVCLERAGAEFLVLCTNTMHKVAGDIATAVHIPLLHIADATAREVKARGLSRVGLLGTRFTMEEDFYRGRLATAHGLDVLVPPAEEREVVHRVIYDELCLGRIEAESRTRFVAIIEGLADRGAAGVVLGCTEIGLLVRAGDVRSPLFDTAAIHATSAALYALGR